MPVSLHDTAILIPVREIDEAFYKLVDEVRQVVPTWMVCVVVDGSEARMDGSRMGTPSIVIELEQNEGKGYALQTGYKRLYEAGYEAVITLDADGQHPPALIPEFLEAALETNADLVIGNRLGKLSGMPLDRRFSNITSSYLLSLICGKRLADAQCGYRWMRLSRWWEIQADCYRFDFEPQLLLQAVWLKWRLAFIPIPVLYLHSGSSVRRVPDTLRFVRMVGKEILRKLSGKYRAGFLEDAGSSAAR